MFLFCVAGCDGCLGLPGPRGPRGAPGTSCGSVGGFELDGESDVQNGVDVFFQSTFFLSFLFVFCNEFCLTSVVCVTQTLGSTYITSDFGGS